LRFLVPCCPHLLTHDASLGVLEEGDDVPYLGTVRHLVFNLLDNVVDAGLAVEEQTVGVGDVLLYLLVYLGKIHHRGVRSAVLHGGAAGDNVGWHVVGECTSGLNQRQVASTGVGVLNGSRGEDDTVAYDAVAGNLHTVAEDTMCAYNGVVTDVYALKDEVVVANNGTAVTIRATVNDHVLTDNVVVTYLHVRLLTTIVEVLRQGGNDGALVNLVAIADARTVKDADKGEDDAVVAYLHVVLDINEGEYLTVVADTSLGADLSFWTYL